MSRMMCYIIGLTVGEFIGIFVTQYYWQVGIFG